MCCAIVFHSYQVFHSVSMCFTVTKSISTNSLLHCFFSPPIASTLLVQQGNATHPFVQLWCWCKNLLLEHCVSWWKCEQLYSECLQVSEIPVHVYLRPLPVFQLIATQTQLKLGTIRLIVCIKECSIEQAWSIRHYLAMDRGSRLGLILRSRLPESLN